MSSNSFNNPSSNTATYKYQDTVLLYFIQAKEKLQKTASKILQSICQCFLQRYEELTTHDTVNTYVQESVTQGSVLLYHICKILRTNSWIILKGVKRSAAVGKSCISIKKTHSRYKEMKIIKDQLINKLIEPGPFLAVYCVYRTQSLALFQNIFKFCTFLRKFSNILPFFALFMKNCTHALTF